MSSWQTTKLTGSLQNTRNTRRFISANSFMMPSNSGSRQHCRNISQPKVSMGHMKVVL